MVSAQNTGKWFSLTRRKMLGSLFIGLAAVLTNFRLNTYANSFRKGRILMIIFQILIKVLKRQYECAD